MDTEPKRFSLGVPAERLKRGNFTDIVVIRPPERYSPQDLTLLLGELVNKAFIPVVLPYANDRVDTFHEDRYFPTDRFRTVGNLVFDNSSGIMDEIVKDTGALIGKDKLKVKGSHLRVNPTFRGGDYVYSLPNGIFIYSRALMMEDRHANTNAIKKTRENGFSKSIELSGLEQDLDSMCTVFTGSDRRLHAVVDERYSDLIIKQIQNAGVDVVFHKIPHGEAEIGGCNIADLRNGKVLVLPNQYDAPTTYRAIRDNLATTSSFLTTPPKFREYNSGPRCGMSSIPIHQGLL